MAVRVYVEHWSLGESEMRTHAAKYTSHQNRKVFETSHTYLKCPVKKWGNECSESSSVEFKATRYDETFIWFTFQCRSGQRMLYTAKNK